MNSDLKGPDFIGIGMERAGTSWLFTHIAAHPEIWVPPLKELHYFDVKDSQAKYLEHRYSYHLKSRLKQKAAPFLNLSERPEFYKNSYLEYLLWDFYYFTGRADITWYKRLFHPRFTKSRVCGEITPAYSNLTTESIQNILKMNPDIKFLLIVRNAKERMWSGLVHHFKHIEKRQIESVTEEEMLRFLENSAAQKRSDIGSILETWQKNVALDKLFIRPFEMIKENPEQLIKETYTFLGVSEDFKPDFDQTKKINSYTKKSYEMPPRVKTFLDQFE